MIDVFGNITKTNVNVGNPLSFDLCCFSSMSLYTDFVLHNIPTDQVIITIKVNSSDVEDLRYQVKTWGEYYELYIVLDVTLMADAFEHFRVTTLKAFGVDPMQYITAPQMAYSLFLKVTMEGDHSESSLMTLARKWAQYIMRINANEGLEEKQLVKVFNK